MQLTIFGYIGRLFFWKKEMEATREVLQKHTRIMSIQRMYEEGDTKERCLQRFDPHEREEAAEIYEVVSENVISTRLWSETNKPRHAAIIVRRYEVALHSLEYTDEGLVDIVQFKYPKAHHALSRCTVDEIRDDRRVLHFSKYGTDYMRRA